VAEYQVLKNVVVYLGDGLKYFSKVYEST